ncbi:MAG: histidine phosphatase family protein [Planctomycetes bacterium]|nr:histidine phosphatase family protein [Planctomycetota bacterium]
MATLILIRHGETDWNRDKIFRGRADIPLGDRGLKQAERVGEALKDRALEAVYTGPLQRCVQTATPIAARRQITLATLDAVTDIDYGDWQGEPETVVREEYPDLFRQWETTPEGVTFPNGEGLEDVRKRSLPAILDVAARHDGEVAVVSHRVVLKVVILGLLGLGVEKFWSVRLDTCSLTLFDISKHRTILARLNDVSHLAGLRDEAAADF